MMALVSFAKLLNSVVSFALLLALRFGRVTVRAWRSIGRQRQQHSVSTWVPEAGISAEVSHSLTLLLLSALAVRAVLLLTVAHCAVAHCVLCPERAGVLSALRC